MTDSPRALTSAADRRAAHRRRSRRVILISAISTLVVIGGLVSFVVTSPGWSTVRRDFFSAHIFIHSFGSVLSGFWLDVRLFLIVEVGVLVVGLLIAVLRTSRTPVLFPLRILAVLYVDLLRGIPTILVVYLFGFAVPALGLSGVPTSATVLSGVALGLCYSAYVSEVIRAGILSVNPTQNAAALALGLTRGQALRHVVLPQAIRTVLPPLINDFISLQKDVALVSIVGPQEAFRVAQIFAAQYFNYTPLMAAALLYLCVTVPLTRIVDHMERRRIRRRGSLALVGGRMP